jgi:predicted acyl esterase
LAARLSDRITLSDWAWSALGALVRPPVDVYEPAAGSLSVLRDLPVVVRDGTTLRVNVVLPAGGGRFPVLASAHPHGKDNLPRRRRRGWRVAVPYWTMRQPSRVRFSSLTGWEAPDPPGGRPRGLMC